MIKSTTISNGLMIRNLNDICALPKSVLVNSFNETAVKDFKLQFEAALSTGQKIVPVYIDSGGGFVYSLFAMGDIIKQSPVPVATIAMGKAMSCGASLLSFGTEGMRFVAPTATVMIHQVSNGAFGKLEELEISVNESKRLSKLMFNIMASNCGQPKDYFLNKLKDYQQDWYLDPKECLKHKLANKIGLPGFDVKVELNVSFG
jgi:ATP-dependent Clp endopeptidase proteolytic subunit ClpP